MNILIVNGSPKGKYSITLQTGKYLELLHPEHKFEVIHAGQIIKKLQRDFTPAKEMLEKADLIIFSYPVYTFIAPSQLHYFIDLMKKSGIDFSNKFATQISTSKHFYDITAHKYVEDNCYDMGLKYIKGLSADMDDLSTKKGQKEAEEFFNLVLWQAENDFYELAQREPRKVKKAVKATADCENIAKSDGTVAIVTDATAQDKNLLTMIERFRKKLSLNTKVINISEFPIKGGCLGCFKCAVSGHCFYKDGYENLLREEIQTCNAIVYAFTIKDHSMGPRFKMYDDRQFCNGHRTVTMGAPVGYLVSGEYSIEKNLQTIFEGRAGVGGNYLCGVATDEFDPDREVDRLAGTLAYAVKNKYVQPADFLGVGGMKIFRDLIFIMQGLMKADHKFYKAHGQYDFPQKQMPRVLAMYLVGGLMAMPVKGGKAKAKMTQMMNEGMIMPYQKALKEAEKRRAEMVVEVKVEEEKEPVEVK